MGDKNINSRNFYCLIVIGLLFCFCQFFGNVAFSFTGGLWNISVFAQIFYDVIIIYCVINEWQNGT